MGSLLLAVTALGVAGTTLAADWSVVPETSSVSFVGVQQGTQFTGRFREFSAEIAFDPAAPEGGSIVGVVQTESVNTRDHDRDAALLDGDWFASSNYPEARFESQSITAAGDGAYEAAGELTLKGSTKPATMKFTFETGDGTAKFAGSMTIDRFSFNVGEGWNDTSWVGQNVDVRVQLDLKAQ